MDVVPDNSGSTAVSTKAPHPHAALLLADFILGAGGQKVLEEFEYGNPTKDYGFKRWYPEQGLTAEQIDKLEEKWRAEVPKRPDLYDRWATPSAPREFTLRLAEKQTLHAQILQSNKQPYGANFTVVVNTLRANRPFVQEVVLDAPE